MIEMPDATPSNCRTLTDETGYSTNVPKKRWRNHGAALIAVVAAEATGATGGGVIACMERAAAKKRPNASICPRENCGGAPVVGDDQ